MANIWENAVITNKGIALQTKMMAGGGTIKITSVKAGSGSVSASLLINQTAVSQVKQTLDIKPVKTYDNIVMIPVQLSNAGVTTAYDLRQVGFYANDPDEGEILYAIAQNTEARHIPTVTEMPGYMLIWNFHFAISNNVNLTATVTLAGVATVQDLENMREQIKEEIPVYVHPSSHPASMITQDSTHRFVTDTEKSTWNGKANASHTHTKSQITDMPTALKNPAALTFTGGVTGSYDGSAAKTVAIPTNMVGATSSAAGKAGLAPAPAAGASNRYLRSDGTWAVPPDNNTTYADMKGATTSAAGTHGLVPAPATGAANRYLRSDGTWSVPPDNNTVYTHPTSSGYKHIPSGGASGQILRWSADGTAAWGSDNNTTYSAFKGATSSAAGGQGLVPAPSAGAQSKYLRADGTWQTPPDTNTTYADLKGATSSAAGTHGLVPAPAAGAQAKYLRGDGTWQTPPNTTYGVVSTTANGLAPMRDGSTSKFLRGDGTWAVPPDTKYTHPSSHPASMITQDFTHRFVTDAEKNTWNATKPVSTGGTGSAYTANVTGISSLTVGLKIMVIPHTASTTLNPTLNLNGLGAKNIIMPVDGVHTALMSNAANTVGWIASGKPLELTYSGTVWMADIRATAAQYLYGDVPANKVSYSNSASGLSATSVQGAIDEQSAYLKDLLITRDFTFNITVPANGILTKDYSCTVDGYKAISLASFNTYHGSIFFYWASVDTNSGKGGTVCFRNLSNSQVTTNAFIKILYMKE